MDRQRVINAREKLPPLAQALSSVPFALNAIASISTRHEASIRHFQALKYFDEIQTSVKLLLPKESRENPDLLLGMKEAPGRNTDTLFYNSQTHTVGVIHAHAKNSKSKKEVAACSSLLAQNYFSPEARENALEYLRNHSDSFGIILMSEKDENIEITTHVEEPSYHQPENRILSIPISYQKLDDKGTADLKQGIDILGFVHDIAQRVFRSTYTPQDLIAVPDFP